MPHPDEGLIHAWLDGALDAAEAARVEALVASDPAWAAMAAEARGLIAASARIVGALDRVPANVVPHSAAPHRQEARRWLWRAAAALALMAGSAVVLERGTPELPAPAQASAPAPAGAPATEPAVAPPGSPKPGGVPPAAKKTKVAVALTRPDSSVAVVPAPKTEPALATNAAVAAVAAIDAAAGGRTAFAPRAAAPSPSSGAPASQLQDLERITRLQPSCFLQREPRDSAMRIIRLDARALADSIRLEKLTLHGDTLAAVDGRLTAVRVRCPQP